MLIPGQVLGLERQLVQEQALEPLQVLGLEKIINSLAEWELG